jgi:hypothetical protein
MGIIRTELEEVKEQFAVPRRTEIVEWSGDMEDEDLIEREDMVVTVTAGGYIKRTPLADFRAQRRGGKGLSGMQTKDEDVVTTLFVANTHTQLLFFTTDGMAYKLKTWRLPQGGRTAKGKAIVNILPIQLVCPSRRLCPWMCPRRNGTTYKSSLPHRRATFAEMHCQISQMSVQTAKSRWTCPRGSNWSMRALQVKMMM